MSAWENKNVRTSLICRALKFLISKSPDNSCTRQCRALILVERAPEIPVLRLCVGHKFGVEKVIARLSSVKNSKIERTTTAPESRARQQSRVSCQSRIEHLLEFFKNSNTSFP